MAFDDGLFRLAHERSDEPFELLSPVRQDGRVVDFVWEYLNPAAAALYASTVEALVGRRVLADGQDAFKAARCAHWIDVMNREGSLHADFSRATRQGKRWYRTCSTNLGKHCAASSRDSTAEILTIEAERETRERVISAARTRDEFLVKLNHELRTPLNAISGWAHLVTRSPGDTAMVQRAAETIARNVRAQAAIVDNLLAVNGIVTGTLGFDRRYCDLGKALAEAVEAMLPASGARWIEIHRERIATGLGCLGDEERLRQIFTGLLDNAVRHTPLNGTIEVAAWKEGDRIQVEIRDSGDGIAPEKLPIVFEMFEQGNTSGSRSHGGLGLGLTIVRSLVELHGGTVALHSEGVNRGTVARVSLPYVDAPLDSPLSEGAGAAFDDHRPSPQKQGLLHKPEAGGMQANASSASRPGEHTEAPRRMSELVGPAARRILSEQAHMASFRPTVHFDGGPDRQPPGRGSEEAGTGAMPLSWRRVLVLEDQADSRELITVLLTQQGAIVRAFDSAEHALAAAEHGSFDLVISDLGMPGMDGLEFMQRLSRRPQAFRAIALTAYADESYRNQALESGFTRVVVKPIVPAEFLAAVLAELEPVG